MSLTIKSSTNPGEAADFIQRIILNKLKSGMKVLFFVTGGSSISVAVKVSEHLRDPDHIDFMKNLTIMLTDERYGPLNHSDSNWRQLIDAGFDIKGANVIPILDGDDRDMTTRKFNDNLEREFNSNGESAGKYKIGLFGIGADGHTAGILPASAAASSGDWASGYNAVNFYRITMASNAILKLDEAVVYAQGENKWKALENLEKDIDITNEPAQILKKVPLLTIFTDYKKV